MTQLTIDGSVNWLEVVPYSKAREIFRLKNGHFPEGMVQSAYWDKHPEEMQRLNMRKLRRSR